MGKSKGINSKVKPQREFTPPDGGWGWMIVIAAGISNLSVLPTAQQFGLLFRDKFARLGITSSETTTVINMNSALTSCVGLANGPLFKLFSYRQVSLTGAIIVFVGLMCTSFSYNLVTYLISFSVLYGAGFGISGSANALALNTYWKNRRRLATGLSWTTTGLGPILWPIIITGLSHYFGETGTVLILAGFSLHAVACALLLQPVEWHLKTPTKEDVDDEKLLKSELHNSDDVKKGGGHFTPLSKLKSFSVFSSQYLYNEDDPVTPGYEIIDPGVPMMIRANDGYFSQSSQSRSRISLEKPSMPNLLENRSRKSSTLYLNESKKNSLANLGALTEERETYKPKRQHSITDTKIPESEIEDCPSHKAPQDLKSKEKAVENRDTEKIKYKSILADEDNAIANNKISNSLNIDTQYYGDKYNKDNSSHVSQKHLEDGEERKYLKDNHSNQSYRSKQRRKSNNFNYESEVLKLASIKLEQYIKENDSNDQKLKLLINTDLENDVFICKKVEEIEEEEKEQQLSFYQKITKFFDLDLLKDFTFVNLMLGMTLSNFSEINFSILTPFILGDYGMTKAQVALFMSLLAGIDICVRFCIPFVTSKISWENNSFFLLGVMSMALGRVVLAHCQTYSVVLAVAVLVGFGKGLRTVFIALVIPSYVPIHKLPGASGLQLLTAGIIFFSLGPVVGWIKDNSSTAVTLHCLNIFTWLTALSWGLEKCIRARQNKYSDDLVVG